MNRTVSLLALSVVCAVVLSSCSSTPPEGTARIEVDLPEQLQSSAGNVVTYAKVHSDDDLFVQLARAEGPITMHRHLRSEETIYLVSGEGVLELSDGGRALHAGDFVVVPRNTPHGFKPTGPKPAVLLSTFVPPFKTGDAILEEALKRQQ
jgi:mannose-6-phosphate isomerase-like protein (cupin superfamily)